VPKKAAYEWIPQKPDPIKNHRDAEGNVIIENTNFYTTKLRKGKSGKGTSFGGMIPYVEEDPNFVKNQLKSEIAYHRSKLQDAPFRNMGGTLKHGTFNTPASVLGGPSMVSRNTRAFSSQKVLPDIHNGAAFKVAGPGKRKKTLGKFPTFMPDPPREIKRVKKDDNTEDPPRFKMNTTVFSRPTPSVVTNFRNIRTAFP
jgi:hypothetical protein